VGATPKETDAMTTETDAPAGRPRHGTATALTVTSDAAIRDRLAKGGPLEGEAAVNWLAAVFAAETDLPREVWQSRLSWWGRRVSITVQRRKHVGLD
jgi:hypothetical protein